MSGGGKTVAADAQFGIVRILRPYKDFESLYGGKPAFRQIMLTEVIDPPGGQALDESAGKTGYDPELVRGLPVPFGSRVVLWIPKLVPQSIEAVRYRWTLQWRLRNIFDYRLTRVGYHYPKQGVGAKDTTTLPAKPRVVLPAANQTVIYNEEPQPAGVRDTVAGNMRIEDVTSGGDYPSGLAPNYLGLPVNPDGSNGVIQQGILDPGSLTFGSSGRAQASLYQVHEVQAVGDELLIGLWRTEADAEPNWNFGTIDSQINVLLGAGVDGPQEVTPDVGVYVMCGSAP